MLTYGTLIKVIAGFYIGCVGNITTQGKFTTEYRASVSCAYKDKHGLNATSDLDILVNENEIKVIGKGK